MKVFWSRYVREPFLRVMTEVAWFGPVVSAILIALSINVLTEALVTWGGLWLGWGTIIGMVVVTVIFVYAYTVTENRRRRLAIGPIADLANPKKRRGLVFLFSREDTLREAIEYHRPILEHCWLLVTPEMQSRAQQAMAHFPNLHFTLHALSDRYNSQQCYQTVADIYRVDAPRLGIPPEEIIADITGGTKPMTMGLIVACLDGSYPIEHVPTDFDTTSKPTGPLPPIQITVRQTTRRVGRKSPVKRTQT